jgi:hypothetical protein
VISYQVFDLHEVRARGQREVDRMAQRIFAVWQPLFSHLDGLDFTFHRKKHLEDDLAVRLRAMFLVDRHTGRDLGLMIARIYEHKIHGETVARFTINAGFDPSLVGRSRGQMFLAYELWRYRLLHPARPFYIVDICNAAASYCAFRKTWPELAPSQRFSTPSDRWSLIEECADHWGARPVEGLCREARTTGVVVRDAVVHERVTRNTDDAAAFYERATGGDSSVGLIVSAHLGFREMSTSMIEVVTRPLRPRARRARNLVGSRS